MGGHHCRSVCGALRRPVRFRYHEAQLPEEMMTIGAGKHDLHKGLHSLDWKYKSGLCILAMYTDIFGFISYIVSYYRSFPLLSRLMA
uniref:Uncharacterized protein n=1 Tax=Arundo donax TaxID=35708 RepID=A0A0A9H2E2_ARUDO